jgi:hypothetical protein
MEKLPLIEIEFILPNEETSVFAIEDKGPIDVNAIHPSARSSNESYEFSGRHDQGVLPTLKSTGPMAHVVAALQEAKHVSDRFLSEKIDIAYGYNNLSRDQSEQSQAKRIKLEDDRNEEVMDTSDT